MSDAGPLLVCVQDSDCENSSLIDSSVTNGNVASMERSGDDCTDEKSRIMSLVEWMCNAKESGVAARHRCNRNSAASRAGVHHSANDHNI